MSEPNSLTKNRIIFYAGVVAVALVALWVFVGVLKLLGSLLGLLFSLLAPLLLVVGIIVLVLYFQRNKRKVR